MQRPATGPNSARHEPGLIDLLGAFHDARELNRWTRVNLHPIRVGDAHEAIQVNRWPGDYDH